MQKISDFSENMKNEAKRWNFGFWLKSKYP